MLFVMHCLDKPGVQETRNEVMPAHRDYLDSSGVKVVMSGPLVDDNDETQFRHSRIGVVTEVFEGREEAVAAAYADNENEGGQLAPSISGETAVATAEIQAEWPELPEDYEDGGLTVQDLLNDLAEVEDASPIKAAGALGISKDEVIEWRKAIEANRV